MRDIWRGLPVVALQAMVLIAAGVDSPNFRPWLWFVLTVWVPLSFVLVLIWGRVGRAVLRKIAERAAG